MIYEIDKGTHIDSAHEFKKRYVYDISYNISTKEYYKNVNKSLIFNNVFCEYGN